MADIVLIQISDLHFGEYNPSAKSGQFANDPAVTLGLSELFMDLPRTLDSLGIGRETKVGVAVAGDLTACGGTEEFRAVRDYLTGRQPVAGKVGRRTGMNLGSEYAVTPGNHDHWGGRTPPFYGLPAYSPDAENQVRPAPDVTAGQGPAFCIWDRSRKFRLEIVCVDSSSGFHNTALNLAPLQHGCISPDQLERVRKWSVPAADRTTSCEALRLIMTHHDLEDSRHSMRVSRAIASQFSSRWSPLPWPLRAASRTQLLREACDANVTGILTGHQHSPWFRTFPVAGIREFRSSTALGSEEVETGLVSAYLHHIRTSGDRRATWRSFCFFWAPLGQSGAFEIERAPYVQFECPTLDTHGCP